jgi:hypothetical protein
VRPYLAAVVLLVASCGGNSATQLPLAEVLERAGDAFDALRSVRFEIVVDETPVFFDDAGTLAATAAEGQYAAPGSFQALVDVTAFGLSTQLGAISIGSDRWVSDPVTGEFELLPIDIGFDPRLLFDDAEGVGETVRALDATMVGFDDRYHIRGTVGGRTVEVLTAGLIGEGDLDVDFFIDGESLQIVELSFDTEGERGVSRWSITFSEFDEPVTIEPPE